MRDEHQSLSGLAGPVRHRQGPDRGVRQDLGHQPADRRPGPAQL